jgi:hypothetical protein
MGRFRQDSKAHQIFKVSWVPGPQIPIHIGVSGTPEWSSAWSNSPWQSQDVQSYLNPVPSLAWLSLRETPENFFCQPVNYVNQKCCAKLDKGSYSQSGLVPESSPLTYKVTIMQDVSKTNGQQCLFE